MPEVFSPKTAMECAYVQARVWPPDRVWRRANTYVSEGVNSKGIGVYLCLLEYYFKINALSELLDTVWFIANFVTRIDDKEKLSVAIITSYIIGELLNAGIAEDDFDKGDLRIKMISLLPLTVIKYFSQAQHAADLLIAIRCYSSAIDETLTVEICELTFQRYLEIANSITLKFNNEKHAEQMQAAQKAAFVAGKTDLAKRFFEAEVLPGHNVPQVYGKSSEPLLPSVPDKVQDAENNVANAEKEFGPRSHQVAHRLAELVEIRFELSTAESIEPAVSRLCELVSDPNVEFSPYVLRRILRLVGRANEKENLLAVLASIEKEILSRKEKSEGLDISLALTLWRLIGLWSASETLVEGRAYLEELFEKVKAEKSTSKEVNKQFKSAIDFISRLLEGESIVEKPISAFCSQAVDETSEFIAMLSLLALINLHQNEEQNVELILNELLQFYSDTIGDASRRVGEMLWLLQETSLRSNKATLFSLIKFCQKKASDEYLKFRMELHLNRMALLIDDPDYLQNVVSWALVSGSSKGHEFLRWEATNRLLSLLTLKRDFSLEADIERSKEWEGEKIDLRTKSSSVLKKMEQHADRKEWIKFATGFVSNHCSINLDKSVFRLLNLALSAIRDRELMHAQALVDLVQPVLVDVNIYAYNAVVDKLAVAWTVTGERKRAIKLLQTASDVVFQTEETRSIFTVKLAELYVAEGNLFAATVLLYQAFFGIPDSQDTKADDALLKLT